MNEEFLILMQKRVGSTSVGPSTARGMGPAGTIKGARRFLIGLDLSQFAVAGKRDFRTVLDDTTGSFVGALPEGAQHWGAARKFLNIFIRGAFYNRYLCEAYGLDVAEPWMEVPLDSHVARGLHEELGGDELPRWRSVKGLAPGENDVFQAFASVVAREKGLARVHLDLHYWRR